MSLCEHSGILHLICGLPTDIFELTPDIQPYPIDRRIAGQAPINWHGQSPRALRSAPLPLQAAFTIIILDPSESADAYCDWAASCPGPVTLVLDRGGTLRYADLNLEKVQIHFLKICAELKAHEDLKGLDEAEAAIRAWTPVSNRTAPYELGGHGTITPNVAALATCGFVGLVTEGFRHINKGEQPYIDQIVLTTNTIFDEREGHAPSVANLIYPRQPDLNPFLPATYDLRAAFNFRDELPRETRRSFEIALQLLERQSGYNFEIATDAQAKAVMSLTFEGLKEGKATPHGNPIMRIRQRETWLATEAVACLAASEISAVVRPPIASIARAAYRYVSLRSTIVPIGHRWPSEANFFGRSESLEFKISRPSLNV